MGFLVEALNAVPLASLMVVVTLGYLLGRASYKGLSLGPAGGTLLVALLLGRMGLSVPGASDGAFSLGAFGFALFVYSVGFEAGPRFFASFRDRAGWRFVAIGSLVNILAVVAAVVLGSIFELGEATVAGALAGALTSAPTFVVAAELTPFRSELSVAFALTYPLGLVAIVFLIQTLPRLRGEDLSQDVTAEKALLARFRRARQILHRSGAPEVSRVFEVVEEGAIGPTLRELNLTRRTGVVISRIQRDEESLFPDADTVLKQGDRVFATGRLDDLSHFQPLVGPEVLETSTSEGLPPPRRIEVLSNKASGRTLAELELIRRFHTVITRIERDNVLIEPSADAALCRGDIIEVVGRRGDVRGVARLLGRFEP